jgi:hypothetical protein
MEALEANVAKAQAAVSKAKSDGARQKAEERLAKAQAELEAERMPHAILFSEGITASKKASKYGAAVYVYPTEDYAKMRLFLTEDGKNGFALKPDGDIVSVFSSGGGTVHAMMELAVEQGGTKLDAFNTVLPKLYGLSDFVEVGRDPWNDEYKPDDWDYEVFKDFNNGRPDIVYMEYRPVALKSAEPTVDDDSDTDAMLPSSEGQTETPVSGVSFTKAPEDGRDRAALIESRKALMAEAKVLAAKGTLSGKEAERLIKLGNELSDVMYRLMSGKPLDPTKIKPEAERMSTLPQDIVISAYNDVLKDYDVFMAINNAAMGTVNNSYTDVDRLYESKKGPVMYEAFTPTRDALRATFGDTMTLYRAEGQQRQKPTQNWATTREYAAQFGGNVVERTIPVDNIIAVNVGIGNYHELIVGVPPKSGGVDAILPRRSGGQLAGAKTRAGGVPSTGQNDKYDATLTQIHNNFIALLNLTVRTGGVTAAGGRALGQHTADNGVIRLKEARDFEVLVHEAWHALHTDRSAELDAAINGNIHSTELLAIATNIYGGALTNATRDKKLREGFAEFGRLYMTNKAEALNWAPNFYTAFENILRGSDPKLLDGLRTIRSQYERLFDLSSVAFGRSFLTSGKDEGLWARMKKGVEEQGILGYLKTGLGIHMHHAYVQVIDKGKVFTRLKTELQNLEEKNKSGLIHDLLRSEDPRVLYEMGQRTGQVAVDEVYNGITDWWGNKNTTASLRDALARIHNVDPSKKIPMDETITEDFNNYLVAKTVLEDETNPVLKARKDKPSAPYNAADAQQIILELEQKYGTRFTEAAEMIYDYNRGLWKKMRDAGLINDEQYLDGQVRKNYVPLFRDMSGTASGNAKKNALTSGDTKVIKQRSGSARDILFPLESIMTATMAMEQTIASNRVKVALAQMADRAGYGSGKFIERVPDTIVKAMESPILDTVNAALKNSGISTQDQDMIRMIMESVYDESSKATVYRRQIKTPGPDGEHIMFFYENGKRKAISIGNDKDLELAHDVFAAMDGLGQENFGAFVDIMTLSSAVTRAGVTSWFDFLAVNYIRDQISAAILTDVGYIPFFSGIKGMYHILKQDDVARDYLIGGGAMGGVNSAALESIQTERDINILKRKGYSVQILGADKLGTFTGVVKALSHLSELMEGATRVGLYEKAYKRAKAEGLTHEDAMREASYIGTDYINFGRHGSAKTMRLLARIIPFFNAQIQGLDKTLRAMFGDEVASRKGLKFVLKSYLKSTATIDGMQNLTRTERQQLKNGRKVWMKMVILGMFGAALGLMFKGDPDYEEATPYLKSRYWVIPLGNGKVFMIPKPFELAIVNNAIEAAIESDGASLNKFLDGLQQTLTPPVQNPLIKYAYEVATNYDTFRDRPLVPVWMQALPPAQQAHAHTATLAKKIGEAIGVSPIYVEHFITSIGASAGRDLMSMLDFTDPNRPEKGWDETAIMRRFIRETRKGGNTVEEFYGQMSQFNGSITTAGAGYKKLMDQGRDMQANRMLDEFNDDQKAWAILNYNWDASYKRMHPGYRTNQIAEVVNGLKKELFLPALTNKAGDEIVLTPGQKLEAIEVLNDILHREMRNYLVAMKVPGFQDKQIMPTEYSYDLLEELNPDVYDLLQEKIQKQKIYDFDVVIQNWPEVKDALIGDREYADLDGYLRDHGQKPKKRKARE